MNILITGGCGYVGTSLTQKLLELGHRVTVIDAMWFGNFLSPAENLTLIQRDIRNVDEIPFRGIEVVIHLANIANDPTCDLNPKLSWEVNVLSSMRLVEYAIRAGVKQFIYASSGSVYGVKEELDVTEELSLVPISDYNKTKMISERVLLSYQDKLLLQIIRPATICGYSPRMRLDLTVNMLTMQAMEKGLINVLGGKQVRPNIHIQDMVSVYLHMLQLGDAAQGVYNAGFENFSILEIAEMITEFIPAEIVISESNDPRSYRLSSNKLIETGFSPKYQVVDGIRQIIDKYRDGKISNEDNNYNVRQMQKLALE